MKNYSKLSTGIKLALCAASLGAYSGLSYAAEEGVEEVERIQVTGSRIRSAEAMSASPIQVLDGASIDKSGTLNLQDLLMENPTFGTPAISRTNSNFYIQWWCCYC